MFFPHSISLFISYLYAYKRLHANKKMPDQGAVGSERATRQWNFTFYSLHFHSLHFNSLHLVTNRLCLHGTWRASSTVTFVFHYFSFWLGHRGMGLDMAWYGVVWRGMAVGSGCLFLFFFFFFSFLSFAFAFAFAFAIPIPTAPGCVVSFYSVILL